MKDMKQSYQKLTRGDEIRVIAPSLSWTKQRDANYRRACVRLEELGYIVTVGKNVMSRGRFGTASVQERVSDFEQAYKDTNVRAILCVNGGWAANELLQYINWSVVADNPKPLIGFSDITVLLNAIYAKTGQIGLLGPNLGSFGRRDHWRYSLDNLQQVLTREAPYGLAKSQGWCSGDKRYMTTRSWKILQKGSAEGTVLGGNIGTFYLLQGTPFMPSFQTDVILAIEDDDESGKFTAREFDRRLESLLSQPGAQDAIKGVLVGRFQPQSGVTMPDVQDILSRKFKKDIPIIADVDFGHTKPLLTLPIGGRVLIDTLGQRPIIKLTHY